MVGKCNVHVDQGRVDWKRSRGGVVGGGEGRWWKVVVVEMGTNVKSRNTCLPSFLMQVNLFTFKKCIHFNGVFMLTVCETDCNEPCGI